MGEIICCIALGGCLLFAGFFYRHFVNREFKAIREINEAKKAQSAG